MNVAHLHLIVTHLPVLGVGFATVLLALGLFRKSRSMQQIALTVLVLSGLAAGVAFWSGEGAEEAIEDTLGAGKSFLDRHEDAGLIGLVVAGIAGAMAIIVLASGRGGRQLSRRLAAVNLVIALVAGGILAWVANLGGQIGHPEIRSGQIAPVAEREEQRESH